MGQKTNPNSLRTISNNHKIHPYWDKVHSHYTIRNIEKIIHACCKNTNIYVDNTDITLSHDCILIKINLLQFHKSINTPNKRSFKHKENPQHWTIVLKRLYFCQTLLLEFTGIKKIKLILNRELFYSRGLPCEIRQQTSFYTKKYNRIKFGYSRIGIQLLYLLTKKKVNVKTLTNFIRINIRTRSRRKKHTDFLKFLKHCFDVLQNKKTLEGLKIQIKGRFGHKPKGRSKIWKYQMGTMPLNHISAPIYYNYAQAQTKLGSVGIKTWLYKII